MAKSKRARRPATQVLGRATKKFRAFCLELQKRPSLTWDEWEWEWAIKVAREGRPLELSRLVRGDAPLPASARAFFAALIEGRVKIPGRGVRSRLTEDDAMAMRALFHSLRDQHPDETDREIRDRLCKMFGGMHSDGTIRDVLERRKTFAE